MRFHKPQFFLVKEDYDEIKNIFEAGWVSNGKYVEQLEQHFIDTCGVKYAIACSSCTQGLILAIICSGWKGRRVGVPAFTWPSTIYAICLTGNKPVFCDICKDTWLMDINDGEYDGYMPVDVFGNESFGDEERQCIYDAAHSYGMSNLGNRGLEVVSFSHTKPITACEGGMILTDKLDIARKAKELRKLSSRMMEVNAYVALKAVEHYDEICQQKTEIMNKYKEGLNFHYEKQHMNTGCTPSVFSILLDTPRDRNRVVQELNVQGIETKVYYEPIITGLSVTDNIYSRILPLPMYHGMEQEKVITTVNRAVHESNFYQSLLS